MKKELTDPRHERLIAYLYGELSSAEARAFEAELERDPALRMELDELSGTRQMLAGWQVVEPSPSFVFVGEERARTAAPRGPAWWRGIADMFTGGPAGFGLGLATAAAAALIIAFTGFRVERVDGGLAFRFGGDERPTSSFTQSQLGSSPSSLPQNGTPLQMASSTQRASTSGDPNAYVTRAEMEEIASQMVGSVVDLLNENGDRQNREFTGVLQTMYEDITDRQSREAEVLRQRMNAMGLELLMRQARSNPSGRESAMAPASIEPRETAPVRPLEWKEEWR